jgi:hypothetical protein
VKALLAWSESPEVEGDLIGVSTLLVKSFNSMREYRWGKTSKGCVKSTDSGRRTLEADVT